MADDRTDPIQFEVVRSALTQVAEEMAVALRPSAYSTNVKTRQVFSCACFDRDGGPVAQAFYILNPKDPGGDSTDDVTATTEAGKLAAIGRESTN